MTGWLDSYARAFQRLLPSPMAIALVLTLVAALSALTVSTPIEIVDSWAKGLWNPALMQFGFQAMFMLVLGHVLALSSPIKKLLARVVDVAVKTPKLAAVYVAVLAMILGWLNWGLGLVAGALVARAVIDRGVANKGVVGAAGYMGLLVWHSGISGSAPLKVAESGHLVSLYPKGANWDVPLVDAISIESTVFASWNLMLTLVVMAAIVCLFYFLGKISPSTEVTEIAEKSDEVQLPKRSLAEKLDNGRGLAWLMGVVALGTSVYLAIGDGLEKGLSFVNPDWINLILLGLALVAHGSISKLTNALENAIGGAAGILLQFPIYFGIMGIVSNTGLGGVLAGALVDSTTETTLPLAIYASSGLLNVFVPSGGGQWAVQGPLVIEACHSIGLSLEKGIMAMAYGDQWTNMLQPFWALPLLGVTGLKAKDILPYTMAALLVSGVVFLIGLVLIV